MSTTTTRATAVLLATTVLTGVGASAASAGIKWTSAPTRATASAMTAPVLFKSYACHTKGKWAHPDVHGTVKFGYRVVNGRVIPVSARFVGTRALVNNGKRARSQRWTFRNASVSTDAGKAMHTSRLNPKTWGAGSLPEWASDTTVTGRWNVKGGDGKTHKVTCTARVGG